MCIPVWNSPDVLQDGPEHSEHYRIIFISIMIIRASKPKILLYEPVLTIAALTYVLLLFNLTINDLVSSLF